MTYFCPIRNEDPAPDEGTCCNLLAGHRGRHAYLLYVGKDMHDPHDHDPDAFSHAIMDPGLFGRDPYYQPATERESA